MLRGALGHESLVQKIRLFYVAQPPSAVSTNDRGGRLSYII